ncbi:MAG: YIP1 family protein [Proteobacteria bacterium]|nr:YIP1 family protein [Pseudomonadota bacterium]
MDEAKIPPRAQMATCPRCAHKFRFRVVDDLPTAAPSVEPAVPSVGGQNLSVPTAPAGADPMAAQRAAAEQAWRHLQRANGDASGPEAAASPAGTDQARPGAQPHPESRAAGSGQNSQPGSTGSPVPFEDLPRHGFFPGLWGTIVAVLMTPRAFFRDMPVSGGMAKPLIFYLLLSEFMILCHFVWGLFGLGAVAELLKSPELMDMGIGLAGFSSVLLLVIAPPVYVLYVMLLTGVVHFLLRLLRSGDAGAEATFRVLCYSSAPLLLSVIPILGPQIGGFWSLWLAVIGLKHTHRAGLSASAFAVVLPILLLVAAWIGYMQGLLKTL